MKISLLVKFAIIYVISAIVSLSVIILASSLMSARLIERQAQVLQDTTSVLSEEYYTAFFNPDVPSSAGVSISINNLSYLMSNIAQSTGASVWIINDNNDFILSQPTASVNHLNNFDINSFNEKNYQIGTFNDYFDYDVLSVYSSVKLRSGRMAYIILHYPMSSILAGNQTIINIMYIVFAIVYGVSLIMLIIFYFAVLRPIRRISAAAKQFSLGNFAYADMSKIKSHDELGDLAGSMDIMANSLKNREERELKFISNVSHDFRSPLTSIKGYATALQDGTIDWLDKDTFLDIIISEANRLNLITDAYLANGAWEVHSALLKPEFFDLSQIIDQVINIFAGAASAKGISFFRNFKRVSYTVYADKATITQAIYNLTSNAIKYSDGSGSITFSLINKGDKIEFSITDTGIGIPKDKQHIIWDRFYKIDPSRSLDRDSFGIGLAIVREIVEAHGSSIDLVSEEGKGSTFTFLLSTKK